MSGFLASLPGACAQGIIWGIMAVGVYLTFKVLDLADLTVDGSFGTGGAVLVVCTIAGMNIWLAMLLAFLAGCIAGLVTGILHTKFGIPAILAGILTQLALYSVNLRIMSGRANVALNIDEYGILVSLRYIPKSILVGGAFALVIIGLLYWFFGTELGSTRCWDWCSPTALWHCPAVCWPSIRALRTSIWAAALSLSAWRP